MKKVEEGKIYLQLYEKMEALVHICRDGCRTIGPHDKVLKGDQPPCTFSACKGLELLVRHFAACKLRVPGFLEVASIARECGSSSNFTPASVPTPMSAGFPCAGSPYQLFPSIMLSYGFNGSIIWLLLSDG
uniref:TAZ-type domain-containing protein n=1 Tax=Nelumbo nucifera TaxID=4432 RepID=A0A822XGQ2_NELNU|nr:TPA_asm: hypothetical protein HUJ06_019478 [Nelumbo nucifera]